MRAHNRRVAEYNEKMSALDLKIKAYDNEVKAFHAANEKLKMAAAALSQ